MNEQLISDQGLTPPMQDKLSPYIARNDCDPPLEPAKDFSQQPNEIPEKLNKLRSRESSAHCQALLATIILLGGIAAVCIVQFVNHAGLQIGVFIAINFGIYVLYLFIGCCCNKLIQYLQSVERGQQFQTYYDSLRGRVGKFVFNAECYHYQTHYHTRTVTDSNGNTSTETYTTTQKVVTHRATQYLTPLETIDESGKVDRIRANTNVVFIHFFVRYRFNDAQSRYNFQNAYSSFKIRHTRDTHQDFSMKYVLPGHIERRAFYVGQLECDFQTWFYLFSAIGMIWPYSLWVESKISRFEVDTKKVLRV